MAARAISSATISFGLVSIPVKLFTAAASEQVRFNMLNSETGARVKQQYLDASSGEVVSRDQIVKGYEYAKGQYVVFEEAELKKLEAVRSNSLEIVEFVPADTIDLVHVEKSYYLGPDKGSDKAYRLLSEAMKDTGKVAIGRWAARGKEQLIGIFPHRDGLILHQLYYANEVRSFEEVGGAAKVELTEVEKDLAIKLIDQLSKEEYDATRYEDEYASRVRKAVEEKAAGQQITVVPEQPRAQIIDLFEALKKSLSDAKSKKEPAARAAGEQASAEDGDARPAVKKAELRRAARGSTKKKAKAG